MFTTVQDLGRPGRCELGVPPSGAADWLSLRLGNRLMGNPDGAAALECTLEGPTLVFDRDALVCLSGAACPGAAVGRRAGPASIGMCEPVRVRAGEVVKVGPVRGGARACLCVGGGFGVEPVMGSRSTLVSAGFGGHAGRALRAGDRVPIGEDAGDAGGGLAGDAAAWLEQVLARRTMRLTPGADASVFPAGSARVLGEHAFTVSRRCDRAGVRLEGAVVEGPADAGGMDSEPTETGGVQVTGDGGLIVLGVDRPTTGGYPVIGCVIAADVPAMAVLRPGDAVRFAWTDRAEARAAWRELTRGLDGLIPSRDGGEGS